MEHYRRCIAGDAGGIRIVADEKGSNESEKGSRRPAQNALERTERKKRRKVKAHPHAATQKLSKCKIDDATPCLAVAIYTSTSASANQRCPPSLFPFFFVFLLQRYRDCVKIACAPGAECRQLTATRRSGESDGIGFTFECRVFGTRLHRVTQCGVEYYGTGCNCSGSVVS